MLFYSKKMKKFLLLAFILLVNNGYSQEAFNYKKQFAAMQKESKDLNSVFQYSKQLKKYISNDTLQTDNEMLHLLIGYTAQPSYSSKKDVLAANPIFKLNEAGKFQLAKEQADKILQKNPFHIKVMIEMNYSLTNLGKLKEAKEIQYRMFKIYKAMLYSCGGKPQENSIFALAPEDGQSFVKFLLRETIDKISSGKDKDGNTVDMISIKKNGKTVVYRFLRH